MKKSQYQIVYERAWDWAQENLQKIVVEMGDFNGSNKCHHVARHHMETGEYPVAASALCFLPGQSVIMHFVNKDSLGYIDHSLGYLSSSNTYFLINEYQLEDLKDTGMYKLIHDLGDEWLNKLFTKEELKDNQIDESHLGL